MDIITAIKKILMNGNRPDGTPAFHASPDFVQISRRIYTRNQQDPGDCAGDEFLLLGLSLAEAHIGTGTGWIPEVQKVGVRYAEILEKS